MFNWLRPNYLAYGVPNRSNSQYTQMELTPISQQIENIKSDATIWNEYYIYFLSKQEHMNYQVIKDIAELADAMLVEYKERF